MAIFQEINMSTGKFLLLDRIKQTGDVIGQGSGLGNPFGYLFLLAVLFITLLGAKAFTFSRSLLVSSFLGLIVSLLLTSLGWLSSSMIYTMGIIFGIALLLNIMESSKG